MSKWTITLCIALALTGAGCGEKQPELPKGVFPGKQYVEATFPSGAQEGPYKGKKITFYIPKAYVEWDGIQTLGDRPKVPINFELPEKIPSLLAPPYPWAGMDYRSPQAEALRKEFYKAHHGRFRMMLNFGVGSAEQFMRVNIDKSDPRTSSSTPYVQLSPLAGLQRYAPLRCFEKHADISHVELQRQLAQTQKAMRDHIDQSHSIPFTEADLQGSPDGPPVPPNCVVLGSEQTLFTPVGTPEVEALYVDSCDLQACDSYISVNGVDVRFSIPLELLTRWREIALPSQELLRSFLIHPPASAASQPAAPVSHNR
ncbi:MAG: hypothetical protein CFE43_10895 [Burkholderiales bacterium PBB3]|nr:MAG: hypothetical protein CFE43_10895 [Burkholderiales bacterium PBB3]